MAQLEARQSALSSVAQRLPVLREQHARQVAEVEEVAQMELKIAELKQQVGNTQAGVYVLLSALGIIEIQVCEDSRFELSVSTGDWKRRFAPMKDVDYLPSFMCFAADAIPPYT